MRRDILFRFLFSVMILLPVFVNTAAEEVPDQNKQQDSHFNVDQDYRFGTGDMIRIQVYDEDDLNQEQRVSDRGTISYPFLGELKVVGLTPAQLAHLITEQLIARDYLLNPKVSVDIIEYRKFFVNGEVEAPGGFPYQPGITVRKAISLAGGFKERADRDNIFIVHDNTPDKKPVRVKLEDAINPGDIITVEQSFF